MVGKRMRRSRAWRTLVATAVMAVAAPAGLLATATPAAAYQSCTGLSGVTVCFETYGDIFYVEDNKADGAHPEAYFGVVDDSALYWGYCKQTFGADTVAKCDFDFPEDGTIVFAAARVDNTTVEDYTRAVEEPVGAPRIKGQNSQEREEVREGTGKLARANAGTEIPEPLRPRMGSTQELSSGSSATTSESGVQDERPNGTFSTGRAFENVRTLTLSEVKKRGLGKYVDERNYNAVPARRMATSSTPDEPVKKSSEQPKTLAATCWTASYGWGIDQLYGQTDVTWCGNGSVVTYSAAGCWGDESWPLYKYLGCKLIEDFGHPKPDEYWNVYDVWSQYELCPVYLTKWGGCFITERPRVKYRFGASGEVWLLQAVS